MAQNKRLSAIIKLVGPGYDHIWDCCCDHGLLGTQLVQTNAAKHIHFVDCVAGIIDELTVKLTACISKATAEKTTWHAHLLDVLELPIGESEENSKHLIIIAGVGSELTLKFVRQLSALYPQAQMTFLLCPVRDQFELRQGLRRLNYAVLDEALIEENKRFYEIMLVCPTWLAHQTHPEAGPVELISDVGSIVWQAPEFAQQKVLCEYAQQTIKHLQRRLKGYSPQAQSYAKTAQKIRQYQVIQDKLEQGL